jgi:hypothetical protein
MVSFQPDPKAILLFDRLLKSAVFHRYDGAAHKAVRQTADYAKF